MEREVLSDILHRLIQLQEEIGGLIQLVRVELNLPSSDSVDSAEEKRMMETLSLPIEKLKLNRRSFKGLRADGIFYIGELVQRNQMEVLKIPGLGPTSLMNINEALASKGLSLGMTLKHWSPPAPAQKS